MVLVYVKTYQVCQTEYKYISGDVLLYFYLSKNSCILPENNRVFELVFF